ncbi:MAG: glycine radical domain-containing protein [Bacteroidales bacterium]
MTITANIPCDAVVGATSDGRKAGEPTADGISPSRGTIKNGPTAVLKSVGKLSTELFSGGQLLNMRVDPKTIESPEAEKKLGSLLRGFGDLKCWHVQFNMVSNETLRDAQNHPEIIRI